MPGPNVTENLPEVKALVKPLSPSLTAGRHMQLPPCFTASGGPKLAVSAVHMAPRCAVWDLSVTHFGEFGLLGPMKD